MAIDIRATVTCSLGTLISASVSDDYIQGSGLIKTKGTCEISGTITPAIGTAVTFSYTKGGVTRSIPRKLRVLSSFADPFRRTTKVELGCKLTYLQDLKEPVDWTAFDDPGNASYSSADAEIITIPISASSVMNKCLTELGLTASSNPLTNKFSIASFDLSGGYVSALSDLLVSESYCGYLDTNEVLQVFSLDQDGGTGPVIDSTKIIDLGSIGVGDLPGEAVTVSYSSLKLKQPDNANGGPGAGALWESNESSNQREVVITYNDSDGNQQYRTYTVLDTSTSTTTYQDFTIKTLVPGTGSIKIISGYEKVRKVASRRTIEQTGSVSIEGSLAASYLANGINYYSSTVTKDTTETFQYDAYGNETLYTSITLGSTAHLAGGLGVQEWVIDDNAVSPDRSTNRMIAKVERFTETIDDYQRVVTKTYGPWSETIAGQQALASGLRDIPSAAALSNALSVLFPQALYLLSTTVETRRSSEGEIAPTGADVTNSAGADGGDPNNGYRTDSTADLELALGSATAQRRIEFSMPYAPDDTFYKSGANYYATPSDAPEKARRYGRCQNRLLLGNRSGMNLQLAPEVLPSAPFAPIVVQANGLSALYRVNGASWTMSSEGVVVATDALFWGAVGGTGVFWFPVAPGISTLPSTPPVVSGQMTVSSVVPVWAETLVLEARVRSTLSVTSLSYALEQLTLVAPTVRSKIQTTRISAFTVSSAAVTITAYAPNIPGATWHMRPPAADTNVTANVPAVGRYVGIYADPPSATITVAALAPTAP